MNYTVAILILDKVDYRAKHITWKNKGHFLMTKGQSNNRT